MCSTGEVPQIDAPLDDKWMPSHWSRILEASCCCSQNNFWNEPSGNMFVAFSQLSSVMVLKSEWITSSSSIPSCSMTCLIRWLTHSSHCFIWRFARSKLWRRSIFSGVDSCQKLVWLLGFTLSLGDPLWCWFSMLFSNLSVSLHFSQRMLAFSSRTRSQSLCRIVLYPRVSDTDATTRVPVYKQNKLNYIQCYAHMYIKHERTWGIHEMTFSYVTQNYILVIWITTANLSCINSLHHFSHLWY